MRSSRTFKVGDTAFRVFPNSCDDMIKLFHKRFRRRDVPDIIPFAGSASAIASLWSATFSVDIYQPKIIRRALDQGTVFALPESSSRMRRPI